MEENLKKLPIRHITYGSYACSPIKIKRENFEETSHRCSLYSLIPFGHVDLEENKFYKPDNQKQKLPVVPMFVVRPVRNEETL